MTKYVYIYNIKNKWLNNKIKELTQNLKNNKFENKLIYNVIGKLRIKNKKLCEQLKNVIIKKNITSEDLILNKKTNVSIYK